MGRLRDALVVLGVLAVNLFAVTGVAVSVRSTATHVFGWHFGRIERFIITNGVPDGGTVIYAGTDARCVSISPNGSRIAFIRSDNKICMKSIEPGGDVTVLADIPRDSWIDWPVNEYVYYVNMWQGNELWRVNTTGTPNPQRVATGLQSAMQFSIASGLNRGTAVTCCYQARSWTLSGSTITFASNNGGCGAGISPDGTMFSNNQGDHASVVIRNFDGSQRHSFRAATAAGGGNWNRNRWSANSNEWVTFTQGTPYQLEQGHHQVLYRIDGSRHISVQPYRQGVYYEGDDFWEGTLGPVAPSLRLDKNSLAFSASIGGAPPASQTVVVSNAGDGTLPGVTVSDNADWLTVTVSGSGNAQTLTNAVSIAGLAGSVYNAAVGVSAPGLSTVQYTVTLTVIAPPELASIEVAPATAWVAPGGVQQFSATGKDQYNEPFTLAQTQWSVSGGGVIASNGLFTAGAVEGGPYHVSASAGGKTGTAVVNVAAAPPVHLKINAGGPAVAGWEAGSSYVSGGADHDFGQTPSVAGVIDPAPAEVYRTVRHQDHSYSFPELPNGTYTVRLHFVDQHSADRSMGYSIEGVKVLSNFNIVDEAGGVNRALVREFAVTVSDGNGMQIVATRDNGNDVFEAGIEILGGTSSTSPSTPPVTVISPNGGEVFKVGDEITIEWEWDTTIVGGVAVWFSADDGENYTILTTGGSIAAVHEGSTRGTFTWTIPERVGEVATVSDGCRVRVWEYTLNHLVDESDAAFSIVPSSSTAFGPFAADRSASVIVEAAGREGIVVTIPWQGAHRLSVVRLDGTVVLRRTGDGARSYLLGSGHLPSGVYLFRIAGRTQTVERRITVIQE